MKIISYHIKYHRQIIPLYELPLSQFLHITYGNHRPRESYAPLNKLLSVHGIAAITYIYKGRMSKVVSVVLANNVLEGVLLPSACTEYDYILAPTLLSKHATISAIATITKFIDIPDTIWSRRLKHDDTPRNLNKYLIQIVQEYSAITGKIEHMVLLHSSAFLLRRVVYVMSTLKIENRLQKTKDYINKQVEKTLLHRNTQFLIRERIKILEGQLTDSPNTITNIARQGIRNLLKNQAPKYVKRAYYQELSKYNAAHQTEQSVIRQYADTITSLPFVSNTYWPNISEVMVSLNSTHYGLSNVKKQVARYIKSYELNWHNREVMLIVGAPGVGKSSIALSIAKALKSPLFKISMPSISDINILVGFKRTYIGSMVGKLMQCVIQSGINNPVILLDEIDKLNHANWKGSVENTLLDILDPEQAQYFTDQYIDIQYDLSKVIFICTANSLKDISPILLDRLFVVHVDSYSMSDKLAIVNNYKLPALSQQFNNMLQWDDALLKYIVQTYTNEYGIRGFLTCLKQIYLDIHIWYPEAVLNQALVDHILQVENKIIYPNYIPKVGQALAISVQRTVLPIETAFVSNIKEPYKLIGSCGDVLKESVDLALAYINIHSDELGIDQERWKSIYINFAHNAGIGKDGPSAGVPLVCALLSLAYNKPIIDGTVATGAISLYGDIKAVGGVKEKILGSIDNNMKRILVPNENANDIMNSLDKFTGIDIIYISHINDIIKNIFNE